MKKYTMLIDDKEIEILSAPLPVDRELQLAIESMTRKIESAFMFGTDMVATTSALPVANYSALTIDALVHAWYMLDLPRESKEAPKPKIKAEPKVTSEFKSWPYAID